MEVDAVDVQLDFAHGLHGGAQGGDVVLEVHKGAGDAVGVPGKLLQLGGQGLGGGNLVGLLSGVGGGFIHNQVQPPAFQGHGLDDLGVDLVQVVVPEGVRVHPGQHQDLAVHLVQPEDAVIQLGQDLAHPAQGGLQAQAVPALFQVDVIGCAGLVRQGFHLPGIAEFKGDFGQF